MAASKGKAWKREKKSTSLSVVEGFPGEAEFSQSLDGGVGRGWKKRKGFLFSISRHSRQMK